MSRRLRRLRRLVVAAVASLVLVGFGPGLSGAAAADTPEGSPISASTRGSWACIVIEHVDLGVCQGNPLPPSLPVDIPDLPI